MYNKFYDIHTSNMYDINSTKPGKTERCVLFLGSHNNKTVLKNKTKTNGPERRKSKNPQWNGDFNPLLWIIDVTVTELVNTWRTWKILPWMESKWHL